MSSTFLNYAWCLFIPFHNELLGFSNIFSSRKAECLIQTLKLLHILPATYTELRKIFKIFVTLSITTTFIDHVFLVLKRIKTYLRTKMGDNYLSYQR